VGVLDVDSEVLNFFDSTDERYLKEIVDLLKIK
jgi:putative methionine-R-sulfoxide reductase with GAF domain